jgi:putative phage-type endonuclease
VFTPEQEQMRKSGITASRVAAVVGLHPYISSLAVWREYILGDATPDNPFMRRGRQLEDAVLTEYERRTPGACLVRNPGTSRHPERPLCLATPDALNGRIVVEAKTTKKAKRAEWGRPGTDSIPRHIICQAQFQMGVCGLTEAHVPVLFLARSERPDFEVFRVAYDAELFEMLAGAAEDFWERYILTKTPPPPPPRARRARLEEVAAHG